jgi:uncharacterized protein YbaR (Trm112 family)
MTADSNLVPIDPELLNLLRCPQTAQPVRPATDDELVMVNAKIASGMCRDASGELVHESLKAGLVSECETWLYPIRDSIPAMIAEESIPLGTSKE